MATLQITVPDAQLPRVVHALVVASGIPQPETQANARTVVVAWIKGIVFSVEQDEATKARPPLTPPDVSGVAS